MAVSCRGPRRRASISVIDAFADALVLEVIRVQCRSYASCADAPGHHGTPKSDWCISAVAAVAADGREGPRKSLRPGCRHSDAATQFPRTQGHCSRWHDQMQEPRQAQLLLDWPGLQQLGCSAGSDERAGRSSRRSSCVQQRLTGRIDPTRSASSGAGKARSVNPPPVRASVTSDTQISPVEGTRRFGALPDGPSLVVQHRFLPAGGDDMAEGVGASQMHPGAAPRSRNSADRSRRRRPYERRIRITQRSST